MGGRPFEFGASDTIDASQHDPGTAIRDLTGGRGVDYAFEIVGNAKVIETARVTRALQFDLYGTLPYNLRRGVSRGHEQSAQGAFRRENDSGAEEAPEACCRSPGA